MNKSPFQPTLRLALGLSLLSTLVATSLHAQTTWQTCGSNQCLNTKAVFGNSTGIPLVSIEANGNIEGWIPGQSQLAYVLAATNTTYINGGLAVSTNNNGTLTEAMRVQSDGTVGLGGSAGVPAVTVSNGNITGWIPGQSQVAYTIAPNNSNYINGGVTFKTNNNGTVAEAMRITSTGVVGIATLTPCLASNAPTGCKLAVNGAIQAKEVVVNTGWSDYVFASDYALTPLRDVAEFVRQNHHLPGIPSAAEVERDGVRVGEMQAKLLAKIEELTLHLIRAEERNEELAQRLIAVEASQQKPR